MTIIVIAIIILLMVLAGVGMIGIVLNAELDDDDIQEEWIREYMEARDGKKHQHNH